MDDFERKIEEAEAKEQARRRQKAEEAQGRAHRERENADVAVKLLGDKVVPVFDRFVAQQKKSQRRAERGNIEHEQDRVFVKVWAFDGQRKIFEGTFSIKIRADSLFAEWMQEVHGHNAGRIPVHNVLTELTHETVEELILGTYRMGINEQT